MHQLLLDQIPDLAHAAAQLLAAERQMDEAVAASVKVTTKISSTDSGRL
jgi:exodeoxyribonuclease V beta subunit